ncbi:MAG: DUF389 domain-containing protein [Flavobacteriaceae bacterium]|nr:DUF389 domain-containing protein [Flavobacteriaceae bacterium]
MTDDKGQNSGIASSIVNFIQEVFNLQDNVDKQRAREEILGSINFKGMAAFILMASVMVASLGLNANSVAVVIGAMLISPLMGPIVGLGYSVAVNDWDTLRRSLINFAIMVVIALLTSFLYFWLVPLKSLTTELRGRIEPTSLDVMIAFFGGFAGIAALSSKVRNANVIAGVAIATALMPPLCTAGYGLAMGSEKIGYKDFTGFTASLNALYLFFINSIFIGIATYLFVKVTRFPLAKYQNAEQIRRTNWFIAAVAVLTMIPSGFIFYKIVNEELFNAKVRRFLSEEIETTYSNTFLDIHRPTITTTDSLRYISISTISKRIPQNTIDLWNQVLQTKYKLPKTRLFINQGAYDPNIVEKQGEEFIETLYAATGNEIRTKDSIINSLKNQVARLNSDTIPFVTISEELKAQYPNIDHFGYAVFNYRDFNKKGRSVMPTFILTWKNNSNSHALIRQRKTDEQRIRNYLKSRLKLDTIQFLTD